MVQTAELVLISTITVAGLTAGLTALQHTMVNELADLAAAFGSVDQSFEYSSLRGAHGGSAGTTFVDVQEPFVRPDLPPAPALGQAPPPAGPLPNVVQTSGNGN